MCVSVGADMPVACLETGSRMHIFGDTLGSTMVVPGALHSFPFLNRTNYLRAAPHDDDELPPSTPATIPTAV